MITVAILEDIIVKAIVVLVYTFIVTTVSSVATVIIVLSKLGERLNSEQSNDKEKDQ